MSEDSILLRWYFFFQTNIQIQHNPTHNSLIAFVFVGLDNLILKFERKHNRPGIVKRSLIKDNFED